MLTVHHLGRSQSERVVWLCEELEIPYEFKRYERAPMAAPPEYKALHPLGTAPIITDGDVVLPESAAIIEYIIGKYGAGRLAVGPEAPNFADYLFWFHFANGSFLPAQMMSVINPANPSPRTEKAWSLIEERLGQTTWFAGDDFTAADIIMGFGLTTMRAAVKRELTDHPNLRAYLQRVGARPAYQRAMRKCEPDMAPVLT